jgi:2-polyprenyl-3-methyl-5-hydroxy-6-metoxy-1,4-benzoquinol methylase
MPLCHSCGSRHISFVGEIPPVNCFGGRASTAVFSGDGLYACNDCHLYFRHPGISSDQYMTYNDRSLEDYWDYDAEQRTDWRIANAFIKDHVPEHGRILDVGCWKGAFLAGLPGAYARFGIEAHVAASADAIKQGIVLVGRDMAALRENNDAFDIITAFDVVEHVQDPLAFLCNLSSSLKQEGHLILSTGNTDSFVWKMMKSKYWYVNLAEHVSFVNPRWCFSAARHAGLRIISTVQFSHGAKRPSRMAKEFIANVMCWASPGTYFRIKTLMGNGTKRNIPCWATLRDHFLIIFRKS